MDSSIPLFIVGMVLLAGVSPVIAITPSSDSRVSSGTIGGSQMASPPQASGLNSVPVTAQSNQTNALRIFPDELEATRVETVSLSVGHTVANDDARLRIRFAMEQFRAQLEQAETPAARRAIINDTVADLNTRTTRLQRDARSARDQFNNGGSARVYLWTLTRLHTRAGALNQYATLIDSEADSISESSVETSLEAIRGDLDQFESPVRRHLAAVVGGDAPSTRVYIATSQDGVVLATIADGVYLRDAYTGSTRQEAGPRQITSISEASSRIEAEYPWAWSNQRSLTASSTFATATYRFQIETPQGSVQAFLDSRSGEIYREIQAQPLSTQYLDGTVTVDEGVRLIVNQSYGGGPLHVRVVDAETGAPLEATVILNDEVTASTGDDGMLWTVTPYRLDEVQVLASHERETVSVSISF